MLCNLQIFSGCVCHLEQLHAQSTFLFPIVFSINLLPLFDFCSVLVLSPGLFGYVLLYLGCCRGGRNSCCLWFWHLVFGDSLRDATSNLPGPVSNRNVLHDGRKHKTVVFFTTQRPKHVVQICPSSLSAAVQTERRTSPFNGIERSLSRAVVIKTVSARLRYHVSKSVVFVHRAWWEKA